MVVVVSWNYWNTFKVETCEYLTPSSLETPDCASDGSLCRVSRISISRPHTFVNIDRLNVVSVCPVFMYENYLSQVTSAELLVMHQRYCWHIVVLIEISAVALALLLIGSSRYWCPRIFKSHISSESIRSWLIWLCRSWYGCKWKLSELLQFLSIELTQYVINHGFARNCYIEWPKVNHWTK